MLNFYPGPSKLYVGIDRHIQEAIASGILSMNHRSSDFIALYKQVQERFESHYNLPNGYNVYFTSSATECWSILTDSFPKQAFLHLFNGSFGEKWMEVSKQLNIEYESIVFDIHTELSTAKINTSVSPEIVCTTLVETSNGTFLSNAVQASIRELFSDSLIAVDATSALAGVSLNWEHADIWFASVQKCLGLPSGLGVLILSPQAQHAIEHRSKDSHYNSLKRIVKNGSDFQTTHTPNILGIYLLSERLKAIKNSDFLKLKERMTHLYAHYSSHASLQPLIIEQQVQSPTVLALKGDEEYIQHIKKYLKAKNIIIGSGYGIWKENTIRIANFPAHTDDDFKSLLFEL
jgi:phosphoserine aminotransferase